MAQMIKLQSSDGKLFEVELEAARLSVTLDNLVRDLALDPADSAANVIPLPNVKSDILAKVIEWCRQHKDDKEVNDVEREQNKKPKIIIVLSVWDRQFFNALSKEDLCLMTAAANYLNIGKLLDYSCQAVSDTMRGKTPEEIQNYWGIKNDFTKEEQEAAAKQNLWE